MNHEEIEDHDRGLSHDLPTLLERRRLFGLFGGAGAAITLAACGADETTRGSTVSGGGEIPEETGGPFPADGSNGVNVLTESGIVRSDLRSSFGSAAGVAGGVPLTFAFTVVDVSSADDVGSPAAGAAVYAWHCDAEGRYSMYSEGVENENYLRGVQEADAEGKVIFTSIFPACYEGRWPHIHFEVYPSLEDATSARNKQRTSQLAFPEDVCNEVYAAEGYEQSVSNMQRVGLDSDLVFSDGYSLQLATMTGSAEEGYTATLRVPV